MVKVRNLRFSARKPPNLPKIGVAKHKVGGRTSKLVGQPPPHPTTTSIGNSARAHIQPVDHDWRSADTPSPVGQQSHHENGAICGRKVTVQRRVSGANFSAANGSGPDPREYILQQALAEPPVNFARRLCFGVEFKVARAFGALNAAVCGAVQQK